MTWRIRLAEREQRIAKLEREIERLQRIEDLRRVTLVTNETCACQHSSVPAGMRRPLSPTADTPSRTSVAAKCHDRAHAVHQNSAYITRSPRRRGREATVARRGRAPWRS